MSIIASKHVWKLKGLSASEKLLLLALADHHNGKTGQCNPLHITLADELERTVRQVKRLVKSCEKRSVLKVVRTKHETNKNAANKYSFPGLDGDIQVTSKKEGGDIHVNQVVTSTSKKHDTDVTQNQKTEPEVGTGNPADTPQGGKTEEKTDVSLEGKKTDSVSKEIAFKVYSVWEKGLTKFQTTKPVLLAKEKRQLKDAARQIIELGSDPVAVIQKTIAEWDRFRVVVKAAGVGFTVAANPDTAQLVKFARQSDDFYREKEIQAAKDAAFMADHVAKNVVPIFQPPTVKAPTPEQLQKRAQDEALRKADLLESLEDLQSAV